MSPEPLRFPEFGDGGDHIGARRARRAFRRCVAFCVLFVAVLWFSEWFLRYDHADRLLLSALTKEHATSARSILRQAVVHDERSRERPSPKYLQALAAREEEDKIIPTYERAYVLDPGNSSLAILFGSQLFLHGRMDEARQRFAEAADKAPDNALPRYLEAAVLPWVEQPDAPDLAPAITRIARTNSAGVRIQFPRPQWFAGLPQDGFWYAELQRGIIDECTSPLYRFVDTVSERAARDIADGNQATWDSWLGHVDEMGRRLAAVPPPGGEDADRSRAGDAARTYAGLYVQHIAAVRKKELAELQDGKAEEAAIKRIANLDLAMNEIKAFELERREGIQRERIKFRFPIVMCAWTFGSLLFVFAMTSLASRVFASDKAAGTIPHSYMGRVVLAVGPGTIFVLLCVVSLMQQRHSTDLGWTTAVGYLWWTLLILYIAFGAVYPVLSLPSAASAVERRGGETGGSDLLAAARKARRAAYFTLLRRYYGIAIGFTLCFVSLWVVMYRILFSLYPWQHELLVLDPTRQESELLRRVFEIIG